MKYNILTKETLTSIRSMATNDNLKEKEAIGNICLALQMFESTISAHLPMLGSQLNGVAANLANTCDRTLWARDPQLVLSGNGVVGLYLRKFISMYKLCDARHDIVGDGEFIMRRESTPTIDHEYNSMFNYIPIPHYQDGKVHDEYNLIINSINTIGAFGYRSRFFEQQPVNELLVDMDNPNISVDFETGNVNCSSGIYRTCKRRNFRTEELKLLIITKLGDIPVMATINVVGQHNYESSFWYYHLGEGYWVEAKNCCFIEGTADVLAKAIDEYVTKNVLSINPDLSFNEFTDDTIFTGRLRLNRLLIEMLDKEEEDFNLFYDKFCTGNFKELEVVKYSRTDNVNSGSLSFKFRDYSIFISWYPEQGWRIIVRNGTMSHAIVFTDINHYEVESGNIAEMLYCISNASKHIGELHGEGDLNQ